MRIGIGALVALAIAAGVWAWLAARGPETPRIAYSELLSAVRRYRVESLVVRPGHVVLGEWAGAAGDANGADPDFVVSYPLKEIDGLAARAEAAGVTLTLENAPARTTPRGVLSVLIQVALLLGVGYVVIRHVRNGSGDTELGGTGASDITFDDVAGTQGAAEELGEMVDFLRAPERFAALGARIPKGALLVEPRGRARRCWRAPSRARRGYRSSPSPAPRLPASWWAWARTGSRRFSSARKEGGVIFVDEIDALGGKRGRNRSHNEDVRSKLVALCEELNTCWRGGAVHAVAAVVRSIIDHVPPVFGVKNFGEVANNYPGTKSFKDSMQHLAVSARKIGDAHLHTQIRGSEVLPTPTQVNFSRDLDVLLAEIVRILK